jgi:hypothetical protein
VNVCLGNDGRMGCARKDLPQYRFGRDPRFEPNKQLSRLNTFAHLGGKPDSAKRRRAHQDRASRDQMKAYEVAFRCNKFHQTVAPW